MKQIILTLLFSVSFHGGYSQTIDSDFDSLVTSFGTKVGLFYKHNINVPIIFEGEDFTIKLAAKSADFKTESVVLQNPYADATYPLSYSVIYDKHIISLFEPGYFACYRLADLSRNGKLEEELNKKKFKSHWLIDDKLHGLSKNGTWYIYSDKKWRKTRKLQLPVNHKSDLLTDEDYLVYNDCHGEWGGTIYFYSRKSKEVHFTSSKYSTRFKYKFF